jgi:hypothetical protein
MSDTDPPDTMPAPVPVTTITDFFARDRVVDAARSAIGLEWPDPNYGLWCMPLGLYPDASRQGDARTLWTCLQHVLAVLRTAGVTAAELQRHLDGNGGMLAGWIEAIGERAGAIVPLDDALELEPADLVLIGGPAGGGALHGLVVTDLDGETVVSSDGGQVDPHDGSRHCIAQRRRVLARKGSAWWLCDVDGQHSPQQPGTGRGVYRVIRGASLPVAA